MNSPNYDQTIIQEAQKTLSRTNAKKTLYLGISFSGYGKLKVKKNIEKKQRKSKKKTYLKKSKDKIRTKQATKKTGVKYLKCERRKTPTYNSYTVKLLFKS